jgi:hypothetical protein
VSYATPAPWPRIRPRPVESWPAVLILLLASLLFLSVGCSGGPPGRHGRCTTAAGQVVEGNFVPHSGGTWIVYRTGTWERLAEGAGPITCVPATPPKGAA